jgi:MFS superfamily sulfate permease-like transporter
MKLNKYVPKDGWEGLKENFKTDAMSGFLVFLLAMPLSLGIAKASGFPVITGLITAIIGGVIVSFFMGSRLSIKGPAAGLIVIVSGSVTAFGEGEAGWHLALGAIVVAGICQVLFGVFKLGKLADLFPAAAIHGMLAAIGIIIMAKHLHLLFGINPADLKGKEAFELIAMLPASIVHENAHLTEIGFASLFIMICISAINKRKIRQIPAPLIVLAVSIPLGFALHIKTDGEISNYALVKIGKIGELFKDGFIKVDFSGMWTHTGVFIQYVVLYALIGSIESLLTAKAMDGLDPYKRKTDYNKDIWAVGLGNTLSGIVGGLPMISEVARSTANISYGAKTRWANFFHGVFLLLAVLFAVPFIEMIPNVALAAMLVFVGFRLAHPKEFVHAWHVGKEQFLVFVSTVIITLATDLLIGVASGIVLELIIHLVNGVSFRSLFRKNFLVEQVDGNHYHIRLSNHAIFVCVPKLKNTLMGIPPGSKVTLDFSDTRVVDHTTLSTLHKLKEDFELEGGALEIQGLEEHKSISGEATSMRIKKRPKELV